VLGVIRFDLVLSGAILFFALLFRKEYIGEKGNISIITKAILILIGYIIISVPFVRWPGSVIRFGLNDYLKVIIFYFFTIWYIDSEKKLKQLILIFILCQSFRIFEPVFLHVTEGYWGSGAASVTGDSQTFLNRLSGAPHDIVNPNQLAWVIVTTMIFLYYLLMSSGNILKIVFLLSFPIFLYALVLTGSRSGFLSLIVTIICIVLMRPNKLKGIIIGALIIVLIGSLTIPHIGKQFQDRYMSIFDSNRPGHDTVIRRIAALKKTLSTVLDAPIFGHGLRTSLETNYEIIGGRAQLSHNLYIEILQELGVIGFIIFFMYVKRIIETLMLTKRNLLAQSSGCSWLIGLMTSIQVWIIMDLFYSFSCFGLSSWEWYFFGGVSAVMYKLSQEPDLVVHKNRV